MTVLMMFVVCLCMWFLGRAQLRAEIADRELERHERNESTWNRQGYDQ